MAKRRDKGQGGISKRADDGRWQASYYDAQGRRRFVYGATKREAQEQLAAALNDLRQGISLEPGRVTVGDFMERWLRDVKAHDVERGTSAFYADKATYITEALGRTLLRSLTGPMVQEMYSNLLARGLSHTTVRHTATTLKAMLAQAARWNLVARNVTEDAKPPKAQRFQPVVLSADEVRQLLAANTEHRMYPAVALAVTTGLRLGELRALPWEAIDPARGELSVTQTIDDVYGGGWTWTMKVPKSERSRRTIALGPTAMQAITQQRQQQRLERMAAGPRWKDTGLVFTSTVGTPLQENKTGQWLTAMQAKAGVPRTRFHDLRHTHATLLLLAGIPIHVVAARLGDDPATVLRVYSHLLKNTQQEAAEVFERLIGSAG
jgi:integrase